MPNAARMRRQATAKLLLATVLFVVASASREESLEPDVCTRLVHQIYQGHVVAPTPPDITGQWTSYRCEIRPGPEYIMRKYTFDKDGNFLAQQYYYADVDCSRPFYTLVAKGTSYMYGPSWTCPGGTEMDYYTDLAYVIPHTQAAADYLGQTVNRACPGFSSSPWRPQSRHELYSYIEVDEPLIGDDTEEFNMVERDCRHGLNFSLHELQLVRVEQRRHHHTSERTLYLGDIHTDSTMRQIYRPTSYQEPMLHAETQGCVVCQSLLNSDEFHPATQHHQHRSSSPPDLRGEWFSERCETRPNPSMFLTRRLVFDTDNITWTGYYYQYADALCREPMFTITARGTYHAGAVSSAIPGGFDYDFNMNSVQVTPEDERMSATLNEVNSEPCGTPGSWEVGVEQDVGSTGGCPVLGIQVPNVEYELLTVETKHHKTRLYLGQRPSDGGMPSTPLNRPTSYQPALVKCARLSVNFSPPVTRRKPYNRGGAQIYRPSYIITSLLILFCSVSIL